MRTIGVDLAASPRTTAVSVITWRDGAAYVDPPGLGYDDERLLALLRDTDPSDRVGVDCPFGWPMEFVAAITAHARREAWPGRGRRSDEHRRSLWFRETDRRVRADTGRAGLSVSFDRLGAVAARWAHLADALTTAGIEVDRTGAGRFVEVYPAAARRRWGLGGVRSLPTLLSAAPWLRLDEGAMEVYGRDEHAFDALVASLAARATALGLTDPPPSSLRERARVEGWIHLPRPDTLHRLPAAD